MVGGDVTTLGYDDFYHVTTPRRTTVCFAMGIGMLTLALVAAIWHRPLSPLLPSPPAVTVGLLDASPVQELPLLGGCGPLAAGFAL